MAPLPCIKLTLLGESVRLYPSEMQIETITSLEKTHIWILKDHEGRIICRRGDDCANDVPGLIALFSEYTSLPLYLPLGVNKIAVTETFTCVLQPFVDGATVERNVESSPSSSSRQQWAKGVTIPRSLPNSSHYIFLRSDDIVCFPDQQLKVMVMIDDDPRITESQLAPFITVNRPVGREDGEVQVESSNVDDQQSWVIGDDTNASRTSNDNAEDDTYDEEQDEGDLDQPSSSSQQQYTAPEALHGTPPSREPTIKETPSHHHTVTMFADNGEEEPYSTAQDRIGDRDTTLLPTDHEQEISADSGNPTLLAEKANKPDRLVADSFALDGTASESEEEHVMMAAPRRQEKTYSAKKACQSRDIPRRSPSTKAEIIAIDEETTDGESGTEPEVALTKNVTAVAVRKPTGRKRKQEDEPISHIQDESTPEQKKAKVDLPEDVRSSVTQQEDGSTPRQNMRRGKLEKSAPRLCTQDTGEEIAVSARKASPQILIGHESRHDTPASSVSSSAGKIPRILLSSDSKVHDNAALKRWLVKTGISIADAVPSKRTTFICVVPSNHSLRSAKVLHSLAMNKMVVTDDWLTTSKKENQLLDPDDFIHPVLSDRSHTKRDKIFAGKRLFFTQSLVANYKSGWADIKDVAREAGAIEVDKVAFDRPHQLKPDDKIVLFGTEGGDADASQLINDHGLTVYSRELFTRSILDGELKGSKTDELSAKVVAPEKRRKSRRS